MSYCDLAMCGWGFVAMVIAAFFSFAFLIYYIYKNRRDREERGFGG